MPKETTVFNQVRPTAADTGHYLNRNQIKWLTQQLMKNKTSFNLLEHINLQIHMHVLH